MALLGTETPKPRNKGGRPRKTPATSVKPVDSAGVYSQIETVLASKESPLNVRDIAIAVLQSCGGVKGFVAKLNADYDLASPGSPERARLTEFRVKLIQMATANEEILDNYELLSEDDLKRLTRQMMSKMGLVEWIDHVCI